MKYRTLSHSIILIYSHFYPSLFYIHFTFNLFHTLAFSFLLILFLTLTLSFSLSLSHTDSLFHYLVLTPTHSLNVVAGIFAFSLMERICPSNTEQWWGYFKKGEYALQCILYRRAYSTPPKHYRTRNISVVKISELLINFVINHDCLSLITILL